MLELDKIYNMDCMEGMKKIDDDSIDLIIADPPYNIGKADWDKIDGYIEWLGEILKEFQRVLKYTGSLYLWHNQFPTMAKIQIWINDNIELLYAST